MHCTASVVCVDDLSALHVGHHCARDRLRNHFRKGFWVGVLRPVPVTMAKTGADAASYPGHELKLL